MTETVKVNKHIANAAILVLKPIIKKMGTINSKVMMDKREIQEHQSFPCNQWFQSGKKTFLQLQTKIK